MNPQKLTTRSQEAIQLAQGIAQDRGNPRLELDHLLAALLDDAAGVVSRVIEHMGGAVSDLRQRYAESLAKLPQVTGDAELTTSSELGRVLHSAEKISKKMQDQ